MREPETQDPRTIYISYAEPDRAWAEWIAYQLEAVILKAWDVRPGANWVLEMDTAISQAERVVCVLSANALSSAEARAQWVAAFHRDPAGAQGVLIPVCVSSCEIHGLLGAIEYLDLVDLEEQQAQEVLLAGLQHARVKSSQAPSFPGPLPRFPGALPLVWMVPFRRNPLFIGREEVLAHLHRVLASGNTAALTQAITGLGGIGKTQTAVEYAYRYHQEYQVVLWMSADFEQSIVSSMLAMATELHLPKREAKETEQIVAAVKRRWQTHTGWLLVVDNADELEWLEGMLPQRGQVLLTTRSAATRGVAEAIVLPVLSEEEGVLLLLRSAKVMSLDLLLKEVADADRAEAQQITQEVGGLPLALDQAGAYIEETGCSLAEYRTLYQQYQSELLKQRGILSGDYPASVAKTWIISFERVERKSPAAAELLRMCAFLAPEAIPEELIIGGAEHLGSLLQAVVRSPLDFNNAICVLLSYPLLKRNRRERSLSIHRLVQMVLKDGMEEITKKTWMERVIRAIGESLPSVEHKHWGQWERVIMQALGCAEEMRSYEIAYPEVTLLLQKTGWYMMERGRYREAQDLLERALLLSEQQQGSARLDIARDAGTLGSLYQVQGKYSEAEPLYARALAIWEWELGPRHPNTASSLSNLAELYQAQGKYSEAESLYKRVVAIWEQSLGLRHPLTATSLIGLAELYRAQGKYFEAEPLYKQALTIWEQELGPMHPNTATSLGNLAGLYYEQGKSSENNREQRGWRGEKGKKEERIHASA